MLLFRPSIGHGLETFARQVQDNSNSTDPSVRGLCVGVYVDGDCTCRVEPNETGVDVPVVSPSQLPAAKGSRESVVRWYLTVFFESCAMCDECYVFDAIDAARQ